MATLAAPAGAALDGPDAAARAPGHLFLRALRGERTERPPVWLMRQAGRYDPRFQAVRARHDFLTMVRTPEVAVEVTLQPVERFGVDAAILFSDILVIPEAMGMTLTMDESRGPALHDPVRSDARLAELRPVDPAESLGYVTDAIRLARRALGDHRPLIGFAGAPWTLAAYMIEGQGGQGFHVAKRLLAERPALAHALLARLADAAGDFLVAQARAGAQALQLFDSWAGHLGPEDFHAFALPYLARAARRAREGGVPVIVFAPGAFRHAAAIVRRTGCDVLGADWQVPPAEARAAADALGVGVQGNLDPSHLFGAAGAVRERTRAMLRALGGRGYVANLGHGVLPGTPVENVGAFVETVQGWRYDGDDGSAPQEPGETR
jgi:uroporphyrinogen decarboxylase